MAVQGATAPRALQLAACPSILAGAIQAIWANCGLPQDAHGGFSHVGWVSLMRAERPQNDSLIAGGKLPGRRHTEILRLARAVVLAQASFGCLGAPLPRGILPRPVAAVALVLAVRLVRQGAVAGRHPPWQASGWLGFRWQPTLQLWDMPHPMRVPG